jgi:hypothetical protein
LLQDQLNGQMSSDATVSGRKRACHFDGSHQALLYTSLLPQQQQQQPEPWQSCVPFLLISSPTTSALQRQRALQFLPLPHTQQSSQENKVSRKFEGPNAVMDSIIL